jgi:hypothetical protein
MLGQADSEKDISAQIRICKNRLGLVEMDRLGLVTLHQVMHLTTNHDMPRDVKT